MKSILFQLSPSDNPKLLPFLKPILGGRCTLHLANQNPTAILEVVATAKQKGATAVATDNSKLLGLLLGKPGESPSVDDYAGSIIEKFGMEFLIVNPIDQLVSVPYGKFLYERYFNKLIRPESFLSIPDFQWELFEPRNTDDIQQWMAAATFIAVDIETGDETAREITCVGFTGVSIDSATKSFTTRTVVIPCTDLYNLQVIKNLCCLRVPKCFQNGKYDIAYLLRYGIAPVNYAFDTINMFHSWYSELPKRLDFIVSFLLRKWQYWKDESSTSDLMEYYRYNAKDCFTTAMSWLTLMMEVPQYAWNNYLIEFPVVFPCILAETTGIQVSKQEMDTEAARFEKILETRLAAMRRMVGNMMFNPSSATQVLKLMDALGSGDIKNTKPASRDKVSSRHPLNKRLMTAIEEYRKDRKIFSSYLRDFDPKKKKYRLWNSRMYYAINPHGTDTGRLAGRSSHFWCGTNIHNQPRDRDDIQVKNIFISDPGFLFGEADGEQAEARDTAYLSGDIALITAVESKRDFHAANAERFFGVPFERIVDILSGKVIDKKLRDLAKRVNHGSNYNMGAGVLLDTMGIDKVLSARSLLGLPSSYTLLQVTQFLLNAYSKAYPTVKGDWYNKVKSDVGTGFLIGPTGWHRRCFSDPTRSKQALNEYVAHPPQSLNAMVLNLAYREVFYKVWMPHQDDFKLGPQIHDSIMFQYREGREDLAWMVKYLMEIPVEVTDTYGIKRTLIVPVALKGGAKRWSDIEELKE